MSITCYGREKDPETLQLFHLGKVLSPERANPISPPLSRTIASDSEELIFIPATVNFPCGHWKSWFSEDIEQNHMQNVEIKACGPQTRPSLHLNNLFIKYMNRTSDKGHLCRSSTSTRKTFDLPLEIKTKDLLWLYRDWSTLSRRPRLHISRIPPSEVSEGQVAKHSLIWLVKSLMIKTENCKRTIKVTCLSAHLSTHSSLQFLAGSVWLTLEFCFPSPLSFTGISFCFAQSLFFYSSISSNLPCVPPAGI